MVIGKWDEINYLDKKTIGYQEKEKNQNFTR